MLLDTEQSLNLAGDTPTRQLQPRKINVGLPTLRQLPDLSAYIAKLLELVGRDH
jgi:hypothetical protein